jgi:hypothetical protein
MMCGACAGGRHEDCAQLVPTGHMVPVQEVRSTRDRNQMVPEFRACTCGCQQAEVPW